MVNVDGSVPPVAESSCEYGAPRMPPGKLPRTVTVGHPTFPLSGTVRDPPSRLETSRDAVFGPTDVGWNPTATVASLPGAMVDVLGDPTKNSAALAPETLNGGVSVTGLSALTVKVAPDTEPTGCVPKSRTVGLTVMPPVAVPLSETFTSPRSMLGTVSVAAWLPPLGGLKVTATVVVPPAAIDVVPGAPTRKLPALAPERERRSRSRLMDARLAMVRVTDDEPPTTTAPKFTLVGDTAIAGVGMLDKF
jgi:hypothetical protein